MSTAETPEPPPAGAPVTLREVSLENLRAVLLLKVRPEQEHLVADNAGSIAQAHFEGPKAWFRAIYAGETPVGFVMLSVEPQKPEYWVWRFMIGAQHQRKGFGRAAMARVAEHVRTLPGARELLLSHVPGEGSPGPFYESLGYEYTGAEEEGELVMRLPLARDGEAPAAPTPSAPSVEPVDLARKLASFDETWVPKVVAELNGQHVKVAKLHGEYVWHAHEGEDELFLVLKGRLRIRLRDGEVALGPGQLWVVPRGLEHQPVAEEPVEVLLFEPASTRNTGGVEHEYTLEPDELERI